MMRFFNDFQEMTKPGDERQLLTTDTQAYVLQNQQLMEDCLSKLYALRYTLYMVVHTLVNSNQPRQGPHGLRN